MSDQQMTRSVESSRDQVVFWSLSVTLIGSFLWRVLTPAHEWPSRTVQIMQMTFDVGMIVGLFGMRKTRGANPLLWIALVAGVGLFAIRMASSESMWTGHLRYWLLPRCHDVSYGTSCYPD
jgi:hypothetical protein